MKKIILITTLASFLLISNSCGFLLRTLVTQSEASYTDYSNGEKTIRFVGMIHIAKQEFYDHVASIVKTAKEEEYVLFYEWVDFDIVPDTEKRKLRKILGFIPSPEGYENSLKELGVEGTSVVQDNNQFLNLVNNKDFKVDLTGVEILRKYEDKYGELILTDIDKNTPLTESIDVTIPTKQVTYVQDDCREDHLVAEINKSGYSKIIILYGSAHEKGILKRLKASNPDWKKI